MARFIFFAGWFAGMGLALSAVILGGTLALALVSALMMILAACGLLALTASFGRPGAPEAAPPATPAE